MPANRTNLSPNTTAACLAALTEVADRTEKEFHVADRRRADLLEAMPRWGAFPGNEVDARIDRKLHAELAERVAETQTAETAMRQARWALNEFRKVAGIDDDRDAAEAAQG